MQRQRTEWLGTFMTRHPVFIWASEITEPGPSLIIIVAARTVPRPGESIDQCERDEVRRSWPTYR